MNKEPLLIVLLLLCGCTETKTKKAEVYKAGFTTLHTVDKTRIYKPDMDTNNYLHYRPLDIDVWYPASAPASDTALPVRYLLGLLEQRANYYTASGAGDGLARQLAQYFCEGFKCSDTTTLLRYKTDSYKNAAAVVGKFPLVIYLAAFNRMSYENFALFETLARKGFVVAAISSIGRYPGDMTMKQQDLLEQVNDAVVAIHTLKQQPEIDFSRIGIAGYSWGGLAGVMLSDKIAGAACIVSLDGSEFHHYGTSKEEDADFDTIRHSEGFRNMHLAMPYLRLESSPAAQENKIDSVYNFSLQHIAHSQIFTIDSAQHEDFDCFSLVVKASGNCAPDEHYNTISKLTVSFLEDHLKKANIFGATVQAERNKIVEKQ